MNTVKRKESTAFTCYVSIELYWELSNENIQCEARSIGEIMNIEKTAESRILVEDREKGRGQREEKERLGSGRENYIV